MQAVSSASVQAYALTQTTVPVSQKTHVRTFDSVQSFATNIITGNRAGSSQELKCQLHWPIPWQAEDFFHMVCMCKRILCGSSILPSDLFLKRPRLTGSHKNIYTLYNLYMCTS